MKINVNTELLSYCRENDINPRTVDYMPATAIIFPTSYTFFNFLELLLLTKRWWRIVVV